MSIYIFFGAAEKRLFVCLHCYLLLSEAASHRIASHCPDEREGNMDYKGFSSLSLFSLFCSH
jgi:hypothetical protein